MIISPPGVWSKGRTRMLVVPDIKDIPEFLKLVIKVYDIIKNNKKIPNVEPYEIIELMLHILFVSYLEKENKNSYDKELANQTMNIIQKN
mgnify:CR=1 FL=1